MRYKMKRQVQLAALTLLLSPFALRAQSYGTNPPNVFII